MSETKTQIKAQFQTRTCKKTNKQNGSIRFGSVELSLTSLSKSSISFLACTIVAVLFSFVKHKEQQRGY